MRSLVEGELVRLTPGGTVCRVIRVTPCAAYVASPKVKPHPDPVKAAAGETITSQKVESISTHAFVYREEK